MTIDPRITPNNGRVAHVSLEGRVTAERFVKGRWMMVQQPMVNITDSPRGARVSQLLFGERFLALETDEGFSFGMAERDGFRRIQTGHYIPAQHLMPIRARFADPVGIADLFLGTPYLWGGTSRWGIDCSGLVQTALIACGVACPRDSDQQEATLGHALPDDAPLHRGDLVFWRGHVGIMSNDHMLLHANAHHMSVAYEPYEEAVARIAASEFGAVTARKRLPAFA